MGSCAASCHWFGVRAGRPRSCGSPAPAAGTGSRRPAGSRTRRRWPAACAALLRRRARLASAACSTGSTTRAPGRRRSGRPASRRRSWRPAPRGGVDVLPYIGFDDDGYEGYLAGRSRNFRSQLGRRRRTLERDHGLSFRMTTGAERAGGRSRRVLPPPRRPLAEAGRLPHRRDAAVRAAAFRRRGARARLAAALDRRGGRPAAPPPGTGGGSATATATRSPVSTRTSSSLALGTVLLAHTIEQAAAEGAGDVRPDVGGRGLQEALRDRQRATRRAGHRSRRRAGCYPPPALAWRGGGIAPARSGAREAPGRWRAVSDLRPAGGRAHLRRAAASTGRCSSRSSPRASPREQHPGRPQPGRPRRGRPPAPPAAARCCARRTTSATRGGMNLGDRAPARPRLRAAPAPDPRRPAAARRAGRAARGRRGRARLRGARPGAALAGTDGAVLLRRGTGANGAITTVTSRPPGARRDRRLRLGRRRHDAGAGRGSERVGGFDERFWGYCEEADLCLRVRRAGFGVGVVAAAPRRPGLRGGQAARRLGVPDDPQRPRLRGTRSAAPGAVALTSAPRRSSARARLAGRWRGPRGCGPATRPTPGRSRSAPLAALLDFRGPLGPAAAPAGAGRPDQCRAQERADDGVEASARTSCSSARTSAAAWRR